MSTAFRVIIEGSQEVPPNNSTASGLGLFIFDSEAVEGTYSFDIQGVDYGPILELAPQTPDDGDDVTSTHFHNGPRGTNGPVVFGQINPAQDNDDLAIVLNADGSWTVSGRWETTDPPNPMGVTIANFSTGEVGDCNARLGGPVVSQRPLTVQEPSALSTMARSSLFKKFHLQ